MKRLFLVLMLALSPQASFGARNALLGVYGTQTKYDVYPGLVEKGQYFGGILNISKDFELHAFLASGKGEMGDHFSISFHRRLMNTPFHPFFNLGAGHLSRQADGLHLNFDIGFQLQQDRLLFRIFHKTQNRAWGDYQYGIGAFIFAAGMELI